MPKIEVQLPGEDEPTEVDVPAGGVTLGKDPARCSVVIPDGRISREHARIYRLHDGLVVEDRGSKNGTLVDGVAVRPYQPHRIEPGSVICLAGVCTIVLGAEAAPLSDSIRFLDEPGIAEGEVVRQPDEFTIAGAVRAPEVLATRSPAALVDDVVRLEDRLTLQGRRLKLLYELVQSLSSVFELDPIYRKAIDVLFSVTPADRCCILRSVAGEDRLAPAAVRSRRGGAPKGDEKIPISDTIVRRVVEQKVSIASFFVEEDEKLKDIPSLLSKGIHSVMCAPLLGRSGVLGVIYADRQDPTATFTADDLDLLNAIAGGTSVAIDNALSYERLSKEAVARAAYGRFVPKHVVDQILAAPETLRPGGSTRVATVLFADIREFTPMAETRSSEDVVRLLNAFFQAMTEIVFAHGGTLDKYIGDELMALFGAPYPGEHDTENAVRAAIEMQRRIPGLSEELARLSLPPISIGIGINTGEVTAGYIGSERRLDYTAIGDTVNLAARLEQGAQSGEIRISDSTRAKLGRGFRTSPLGPLKLKGKSGNVEVYAVDWAAE